MKHISDNRIARLRQYMAEQGYEFFIIYTADAHLSEYISDADKYREYFTGFTGSAGTLLVSATEALLWTDGRYFIQAKNELSGSEIILMKQGESGVPTLIEYLKKVCKKNEKIAFDGRYLSANDYDRLKNLIDEKSISIVSDAFIPDCLWENRPIKSFNKIRLNDFDLSGMNTDSKIDNIRELLNKNDDYVLIISDLSSIMWLTNLRGNDIKYVPVAFSYLIVEKDSATLFVNRNAIDKTIISYLKENGIFIAEYEDFYNYLNNISNRIILIDKCTNNCRIVSLLSLNNKIDYINESLIIRKYIKNEVEISHIRKNHIKDAISMIHFIYYLKMAAQKGKLPNEYEAAEIIDSYRLNDEKCYDLSFETISAYGKNAALPHYSANKNNCTKLEAKGFYLVDCGGQYPSCTTDITRTISLGKLSEKEKACYTAVLKGNIALNNATFMHGCRGENLDILARMPIWNLGLDFRHGTGHGIGCELSVHEGPVSIKYHISKDNIQPIFEPGMVVSDEPGIYLENEFGIRLENELLVVEKCKNEWGRFLGFESLTLVPFDKEAIVVNQLTSEEKYYLNEYHKKIYDLLNSYFEGDELEWFKEITLPL